jgi:hypothetical protein
MSSPPNEPKVMRKKTGASAQMRRIAVAALTGMSQSARNLIGKVVNSDQRPFRLQRTRSGGALTTEPEILPAMLGMWRDKVIDDLPVAKDLPRLARRIVLLDESENVIHDSPAAAQDEDTSLKRSIELTSDLILAIAESLEGKSKSDDLREKFSEIVAGASETSDAEQLVKQMIDLLGNESSSATVRALKTVHQDIVGHCTFQLKQHITSRFMTKDVRTPEGWRISIRVAQDFFQVSHTRREQSIDAGGDKTNHWEFEWELRLLFDPQVTEMRHAQLRVTDLFLSQTIDPQLEEDIKHDLLGGGAE